MTDEQAEPPKPKLPHRYLVLSDTDEINGKVVARHRSRVAADLDAGDRAVRQPGRTFTVYQRLETRIARPVVSKSKPR